MKRAAWPKRVFSRTRGRILNLLRARPYTVNQLMAELNLTDNAVRAQLLALQHNGLVKQAGTQPGFRKPHATYALDPAAEQVFPNAYGRLISLLTSIFSPAAHFQTVACRNARRRRKCGAGIFA
jgi:predicted ArsR family transcriptional regulator